MNEERGLHYRITQKLLVTERCRIEDQAKRVERKWRWWGSGPGSASCPQLGTSFAEGCGSQGGITERETDLQPGMILSVLREACGTRPRPQDAWGRSGGDPSISIRERGSRWVPREMKEGRDAWTVCGPHLYS